MLVLGIIDEFLEKEDFFLFELKEIKCNFGHYENYTHRPCNGGVGNKKKRKLQWFCNSYEVEIWRFLDDCYLKTAGKKSKALKKNNDSFVSVPI